VREGVSRRRASTARGVGPSQAVGSVFSDNTWYKNVSHDEHRTKTGVNKFDLYGISLELRRKRGGYILRVGDDEVKGRNVEELTKAALPHFLERCGERCRDAEDVVESYLKGKLKMAIEEMRNAWYDDLVAKWREHYDEVEVVRVDTDKAWLYAINTRHDGSVMIVKEYTVRNGVAKPSRLVYCGPAIVRTPRGYYIISRGRVVGEVEDQANMPEAMAQFAGGECHDVDLDTSIAAKVPAHRHEAVHIVARLPFRWAKTGTIDWEQGYDLRGLLRAGNPDDAAQKLKAREEILKRRYRQNYYPALAMESIYIASALVHVMKQHSKTAVANWVYVYGAAGIGKSILAHNLKEMWCETEDCEDVYMLYVAGPMNENRLRNAVDIEGPPFIADEQNRESVAKLLGILGSATSDSIGVHASRYGKGFGAIFKVRRSVLIISNVPASDAVAKVDAAIREAVKRRLLVIPWIAQRMDRDTARQLLQELRENTPPILGFISRVYARCKDKLATAANTLELSQIFWACASEVFGIDFGERIKAIKWVESVQQEETAQREVDELDELWATVKAHYRVSDDKEALLALLSDSTVTEYTRDSEERWNQLFRGICGQGIDVNNPRELAPEVAQCLYNLDIHSLEEARELLGQVDVDLIKKIAELKAAGRYPWIKAPSWLVPHKRREVAGVTHVRDPVRNVYRYDLFPFFFKMLFVEREESQEGGNTSQSGNESKEELRENVDVSQNESDTTLTTFTTGGSNNTNENSHGDDTFNSPQNTLSGLKLNVYEESGSNGSKRSNVSEFTNISTTPMLNTNKSEIQQVSLDEERLWIVTDMVAKERKIDAEELRRIVYVALQYFDTYPSVGSIRAVEDLKRLAKAEEGAVKAAIEVLHEVGLLESVEPGVYNYKPKTAHFR